MYKKNLCVNCLPHRVVFFSRNNIYLLFLFPFQALYLVDFYVVFPISYKWKYTSVAWWQYNGLKFCLQKSPSHKVISLTYLVMTDHSTSFYSFHFQRCLSKIHENIVAIVFWVENISIHNHINIWHCGSSLAKTEHCKLNMYVVCPYNIGIGSV